MKNILGIGTESPTQTRPHSPRAKEDAQDFSMPTDYERTELVKRILEAAVRIERNAGCEAAARAFEWAILLIDKEVLQWGDGDNRKEVA
jgi:hypothetical protein